MHKELFLMHGKGMNMPIGKLTQNKTGNSLKKK